MAWESEPKQIFAAEDLDEDLDDIATLINLLDLHSRLRSDSSGLENEFD